MTQLQLRDPGNPLRPTSNIAGEMYRLVKELFPICRSITGEGVRQTLAHLQRHIPVVVSEVPTGTPVFDWIVPREWNIRDAYVQDAQGHRVIDFHKCNLHVLNYSAPVRTRLSLADLKAHLFTSPEHPDWIPYRTSYYAERWGFCLSHKEMCQLAEGEYEVCVDSSLTDGALCYGECYLPGRCSDEVLISCHICHPSLANDNLSGIAVSMHAAKLIQAFSNRRYSYRFLFIPGTIGSITWLARNEERVSRIKHGLVLSCLGDPGPCTYKKSRQGNSEVDRAVAHILHHSGEPYSILEFTPYGYDERQYCSPAFNLPVGTLMRTPNGRYPEYHTSADNLDLIQPLSLSDSLGKLMTVLSLLEDNWIYRSTNPKCEPQLGRRGLYSSLGGQTADKSLEMALLWVLNLADGSNCLLKMAERSGMPFSTLKTAACILEQYDLLERMGGL